jgi:hypothetical protein
MRALPLSPRTVVATQVVNTSGGGTFAGTNAMNPGAGQQLYLEQYQ